MDRTAIYKELGICKEVYDFGEKIIENLKERFDEIDANAEYNQLKVVAAMQKNRVSATNFMATMTKVVTILKKCMQTASIQKRLWYVRRLPAVHTLWQLL